MDDFLIMLLGLAGLLGILTIGTAVGDLIARWEAHRRARRLHKVTRLL